MRPEEIELHRPARIDRKGNFASHKGPIPHGIVQTSKPVVGAALDEAPKLKVRLCLRINFGFGLGIVELRTIFDDRFQPNLK